MKCTLRTICCVLLIISTNVLADYKEDIKYDRLVSELGVNIPTGSGVSVHQVEAFTSLVDHDNDGTADVPVYWPDYGSVNLVSDSIIDITGAKAFLESFGINTFSSHATGVAVQFYGSNSIAPNISTISIYLTEHWLGAGILDPGTINNDHPIETSARISNHSYVGNVGATDFPTVANTLRRSDWLIDTDEHLQITGLINSSNLNAEIFSNAFNVVRVGKTDGNNGSGTSDIDSIYIPGRTGIDIVVGVATSSTATPIVASATGLLLDVAHDNPSFSTDPVETFTTNRIGNTIYNAERVEVIKAVMLAGANRQTQNTDGAADITDYREAVANQSANGLDIRYGAGQLNIYNSYRIIVASEQNSIEDGGMGSSEISDRGFDYDPSFGGLNSSNTLASYHFSTGSIPEIFTASLVWNLEIDEGPSPGVFLGNATFYDLDLHVYDVTSGQVLVTSSASDNENSENIWVSLAANRNYLIQVEPKTGQSIFEWDYALAWQMIPEPSAAPPVTVQVPIPLLGLLVMGVIFSIFGVLNSPKSN